jgi:heme-degrading monooxygenase HmoA
MSEHDVHSLVLAADFRVNKAQQIESLINARHSRFAKIGAHHMVVYVSLCEPGRVLVTIGIRHQRSVQELLRSPVVFEWFDMAGVDDIPAIFAGEVLEKIDLQSSGANDVTPGVIVGAVSAVDDVSDLMSKVHGGLERFRLAGVRQLRVYRALDDDREVMALLELDSQSAARHWIEDPDAAAEWMSGAGMGAYPSLFVGNLAHAMSIEAAR